MSGAKFVTNDGREAVAQVEIQHLSNAERVKRGLQYLGTFWGIGLACVLVPILHFVLVPGFLIVGIVAFINVYSTTKSVKFIEAKCPACGASLKLPKMITKGEIKIVCPECRFSLILHVDGQPA